MCAIRIECKLPHASYTNKRKRNRRKGSNVARRRQNAKAFAPNNKSQHKGKTRPTYCTWIYQCVSIRRRSPRP